MLSSILPFLLSNHALPATRSLRASSFMASLNTVTCIELPQISECMIAIYDDSEWTVVAYLLSHMKCGEAALPERLQIQSTAVDPSIHCINTHRDPHAKTIFCCFHSHNDQSVLHNTNRICEATQNYRIDR